MDIDRTTCFECAACGTELPVSVVQYDRLGYPKCSGCGARTGPLASVEAEESLGGVAD